MDTPDARDTVPHLLAELHQLRAQVAHAALAETERVRLNALSMQLSLALVQTNTLSEMLHACTNALVEYLDAAFARIWILNDATHVLELQASSGVYTHLNGSHSRIPLGQFKIGHIAQTRLPHLTNEVIGDPRVHDQEWARREGMVAFAGYPLLVEDRVVGVMALFARHPLTTFVLDGMRFIANVVALGIDHKRTEDERNRLFIHEQHARAAEQALQLRNAFLSQVSHDLRSPLTVIKILNQRLQHLLVKEALNIPRLAQDLESIDVQTRRMSLMIDDLLDLAQLQVGQNLPLASEVLDLVALVRRIAYLHQRTTQRHQIVVDALVPELMIAGDTLRLERVCANLLSNAMKYSSQGGTITVKAAKETDGINTWAELSVRDQGLGVPAGEVSHIFEPFYRASNVLANTAGTGVGLASVAQIIKQHGGTITVDSEEGRGTTFIIHLPLIKREISPKTLR